jgi:hypothetical protein
MIAATALNDLSPHVKRRGRACRVKTLGWDSYLVTPPETGKLKRLVHFDVSEQGVVKIECVSPDTGEVCEANSFSKICSHVQAAALRLERNIKREEGHQAKARQGLKRSKVISKEVKKHPIQRRLT